MLIKKFIIGTVCTLFLTGAFIKVAISSEEATPQTNNNNVEPVIKLVEEHKAYLATPKNTFQYFCSPCHGKHANGKGIYFTIDLNPTPTDLTNAEYMSNLTDDYLLNFISKGSVAMGKSDLCPPWGGTFDKDRIKGVIAYLRGLVVAKSEAEEVPVEKEAEVKGEGVEEGEGKEEETEAVVKASEGESHCCAGLIKWGVLITLCVVFVIVAKKEWKKLGMEEASKE